MQEQVEIVEANEQTQNALSENFFSGVPEQKFENHRSRRWMARNYLKSLPVTTEIKDVNGFVVDVHKTTEYRVRLIKERYNYTEWSERISRSVAYGNKLHQMNKEKRYTEAVRRLDESDKKYLKFLKERRTDAEAQVEFNKFVDRRTKRENRKFNKLMNAE